MIDTSEHTINEIKEWLNDECFTDAQKIEGIASMTFLEITEEERLDMIYEYADDFQFYLQIVSQIDFIAYDGDSLREMCELLNDRLISHKILASDKMKKQYKYLNNLYN